MSSKKPDLPLGIGPHEGRELELMLTGKIPEEIIPESAFAPYVNSKKLNRDFWNFSDPSRVLLQIIIRRVIVSGAAVRIALQNPIRRAGHARSLRIKNIGCG